MGGRARNNGKRPRALLFSLSPDPELPAYSQSSTKEASAEERGQTVRQTVVNNALSVPQKIHRYAAGAFEVPFRVLTEDKVLFNNWLAKPRLQNSILVPLGIRFKIPMSTRVLFV